MKAKKAASVIAGLIAVTLSLSLLDGDSAPAAPASRYVLSAGTVRDTKTGLVWQLSAAPAQDWTHGRDACAALTLTDSFWRLPTIKELATLIDPAGPPHIDQTAFGPSSPAAGLWSASAVLGSAGYYWVVGLDLANILPWDGAAGGSTIYYRCVRVGPRPPVVDAGPPQPTISFRDDFEDGTFDDWTLGNSTATYAVTTATAAAGTSRSFQMTGGDSWYAGPNQMFTDFRPARASWWIRIGAWGGGHPGGFALTGNRNANQPILVFFALTTAFTIDGSSQLSSRTTITPALDRWYHVEVDINWTTRRFVVRIDGTMIGETGFGSSPTNAPSVVRLDIFNPDGGTATWDEIELGP
jgi:hypothetical protein